MDSLSSTSSTSTFIAGMGPTNGSQQNSLSSSADEDEDQSDQMPHRLPDDDGVEDQTDDRRNHVVEENVHHSPKHRVIVSSTSSDDYSSQNAFAKFHKLDQQLQHQQQQNYQRNRSVSPPGPAPVFKNQIHVQNSPMAGYAQPNHHHHRDRDNLATVDNNNFGHSKIRESPERSKTSGQREHGSSKASSSHQSHNQKSSSNHVNNSNGIAASVLTPLLIEVCVIIFLILLYQISEL
jgi:hypothetical protein